MLEFLLILLIKQHNNIIHNFLMKNTATEMFFFLKGNKEFILIAVVLKNKLLLKSKSLTFLSKKRIKY